MKTIEGDLFAGFVAAGAISKANATDPKKSSLVRCARTDKGVHAAGNVVSLKLIVEDPDVVKKINDNLSPQIRVWGIEQTSKSFSSYQMCDSRIYEYLIPTHCFLPPHRSTYMGKKIDEYAEKNSDIEGVKERQREVASFWKEVDKKEIKPIVEGLPESIREHVRTSLCLDYETDPTDTNNGPINSSGDDAKESSPHQPHNKEETTKEEQDDGNTQSKPDSRQAAISDAIRTIRAAYMKAKKAYRIHPERLQRVKDALQLYIGTRNFHNYTIQKKFHDASARRHIKSFDVSRDPLIINGTEWLSLKVHGQSFMMHQIRKMVAMVAMLVRSGADIQRIVQSYGPDKIPIPKAPGLGLLLERPLFNTYNNKRAAELGRSPIDFSKFDIEIEEFKQREIYQRIFREEEETDA